MQLAIDTLAETPQALRLAAYFLETCAALREATDGAGQHVPQGTQAPAPQPDHATAQVPPPPPPPPPVEHPSNTVPPPPAAELSGATDPATASSVAPDAQNVQQPLPIAEADTAPSVDEFDVSGVPFDDRIHQKSRKVKRDGTWKIKKGLDPAIVSAVMKELSPRIRVGAAPNIPATVGASPAPVSLHAVGENGGAELSSAPPVPPPPPSAVPQESVAPPPPPPPAPQAQAPGAPQAQAPGAQNGNTDPYRALVAKIVKARQEGKITQEEVTHCVTSAGVPSLQLLNNMPHLVVDVETNIDAILATR